MTTHEDLQSRIHQLEGTIEAMMSATEDSGDLNAISVALFKSIPCGLHIVDERGVVLFENDNMARIMGTSGAGMKCWEQHPGQKQCDDCPLKGAEPSESSVTIESGCVVPGRFFEITHSPMQMKGKTVLLEIFHDITEKKRSQDELRMAKELVEESERKYKQAYKTSPDSVNINKLDGTFVDINEGFTELTGYTFDDVIGKNSLDLNIWERASDRQTMVSELSSNGKVENMEAVFRCKDGSTRTALMSASVLHLGGEPHILSITRDITDRKRIENELKAAKEKTEENERLLIAQNQEVTISNERLESLLRISQFPGNSTQELLDFALEEAINLTRSKVGYIYFYDEDTRKFTLNTWSQSVMKDCAVMNPQTTYDLDNTGCWGDAVRMRKPVIINDFLSYNPTKKGTPEGHVRLLKFMTIPVIFDGKIVAVAGVANKDTDYDKADIRQLSLLMDNVWRISERIMLIDKLKMAVEASQESDMLKSAFLQNISHEVRTPLNSIVGFSQLITRPNLPAEKIKLYSKTIINNSDKLVGIITDVIDISQIQARLTAVNMMEFDTRELLNELVASFEETAIEKGVAIEKHFGAARSVVTTDKGKFQRIARHLIDNAVKFTDEGKVSVCCTVEKGCLTLKVSDTGIGFSHDIDGIIFEPFRQAELGMNRTYGGNGLGLSIVKAYTELLKGNITFESELGKGTSFTIEIPVRISGDNEMVTRQSDGAEIVKTILIAEDEYSNYLYIIELLDKNKYQVYYASNGLQATNLCQEKHDIDLVLMDIKMPIMDGYTAAKQIKTMRPTLPIIAQTAYALESEKTAFAVVFDDYITKPIIEKDLYQKLSKYI